MEQWTNQQERIIINEVERTPYNKRNAFERAAKIINRSACSCCTRYYNVIIKSEQTIEHLSVNKKESRVDLLVRIMNEISEQVVKSAHGEVKERGGEYRIGLNKAIRIIADKMEESMCSDVVDNAFELFGKYILDQKPSVLDAADIPNDSITEIYHRFGYSRGAD